MRGFARRYVAALVLLAAAPAPVMAELETQLETQLEPGREATAEWFEFRSEDGRFQVELPVEPDSHQESRNTLLGRVTERIHRLRFQDALIALEVHDLPNLASALMPSALILDRTRAGIVAEANGREVESRKRTHQGYPALDFTYSVDDPPGFERALVVLVGSRIYVVTGLTPDRPAVHPVAARVFRSFTVWATDESQPTASPAP